MTNKASTNSKEDKTGEQEEEIKAAQAVEPESPNESRPTVTTTAGGDGLSLTVGQPNIF